MAMSKTDLKNAFREVVSLEFAYIPTDESSIDFTFSERFNKRMEKLIRSQKKVYYNFINTAYKRIAIICFVLFIMLTTVCSVKAIHEPIVNFFTEVYESFTRYFFEGDTADIITKEYLINELPNGFVQIDKISNDISITTTFENVSGDIIEFYQTITKGTEYLLDTEHGTVVEYTIGNDMVHIMESNDTKQAIWIRDEYCLTLTIYGELNIDEVKQIIESIE